MRRWHSGPGFAILLVCISITPTLFSGQTEKSAPPSTEPRIPPYLPAASDAHPGPAWFIDVASRAGLRMENVNGGIDTKKYIIETTGSGVAIFDYDNDGWPDIFLVNGTTLDAGKASLKPSSHLFHNNHDGTFTDVTAKAGLTSSSATPGWGQGVCV